MYPHRIRLRAPWDREPLADGTVLYSRRFGVPRRNDPDERIWLEVAGLRTRAMIKLNDVLLGEASGPFEKEVTEIMADRNGLAIEAGPVLEGELPWDEVALEIRREAFLQDVRAVFESGCLRIAGDVIGQKPEKLEIYAILGRSTVAYAAVSSTGPFELSAEMVTLPEPAHLRVELVCGAEVWYAFEDVPIGS